jgi:hypothetical protein
MTAKIGHVRDAWELEKISAGNQRVGNFRIPLGMAVQERVRRFLRARIRAV